MKKISSLTAVLLLLFTSKAFSYSEDKHWQYSNNPTVHHCYDVYGGSMSGLWGPRDASLINRVGGSCVERGLDDGDLSNLEAKALSKRDIKRALRRARKRFPDLLQDAWLIGAENVRNSGAKYVKYSLSYQKFRSDQIVKIKVKQNCWTGKIKRMKPRLIAAHH